MKKEAYPWLHYYTYMFIASSQKCYLFVLSDDKVLLSSPGLGSNVPPPDCGCSNSRVVLHRHGHSSEVVSVYVSWRVTWARLLSD